MRYFFAALFTILGCICSIANTSEYGLHIRSYPLPISQFSTIALEKGEPIKIHGERLDLEFDLWVRSDNVFGVVLRVITDNNENIDLMFTVDKDGTRLPFLLIEDEVFMFQKEVRLETWVGVKISIDSKSEQILLNYDDEKLEISCQKLRNIKNVRIAFGRCPFDGFTLDDVASVNIKNISLKRDNEEIRFWKMAQHDGDICYDEIAGAPATGKNTQWIIDDYIRWRNIYKESFNTAPSVAFDSINVRFFITTETHVHIFSPIIKGDTEKAEIQLDTLLIKGGEYAASSPNQMIYIYSEHLLLSYNLTEDIYSAFDLEQRRWRNQKKPSRDHDYWNSSVIYNVIDSALISFGGYGHYFYKNELLFCYPLHQNKQQQRMHLASIDPRYSPASAIVGENLYVFGGRGSPTGRQELFPRNYYDLYSVNLNDKTVEQLWSLPGTPENGDFIPSDNMIYDHENKCFYLFASQQGGVLIKIGVLEPVFEQMSLPIGIQFNTHYIFNNLFFAPGLQKLYATILLSEVEGETTLEIYEINYPPISIKTVEQVHPQKKESLFGEKPYRLLIFIFAGMVILLLGYYFWRRRINRQRDNVQISHTVATVPPTRESDETVLQSYDFSRECICFLGRFRVFDRKRNDVTSLFSPMLKSLLIALICYSIKDSRGINGDKLIKLLWYDKSEEAAKNNRNVSISKLRAILEEIGDVKIINKNGFWKIHFEGTALCDYLELKKLLEERDSHNNVRKVLELLSRGALLPNTEVDWVDVFKNELANTVIDYAYRVLKEFELSDLQKLNIADILFQYDFLNEEALQIKCSILHRQSKIGLAKAVYDTFCIEYKSALEADYYYSFMQVIEQR